MKIEISDRTMFQLLKLQALESGKVWNFTHIEPVIDRLRYRIFDMIMTATINEFTKAQKNHEKLRLNGTIKIWF